MGSANAEAMREFFETGSEPEYFCTFTRTMDAGNGNVRIFCYAERYKGQFHLLYTCVIPSPKLAGMGRRAVEASQTAADTNFAGWSLDETMQ